MIGVPADRKTVYGEARPLPNLTLNEQELMGTYPEFMQIVMDMLQSFHWEKPIIGDDLYSFFGLCFGVLIDDDSRLKTPVTSA
jgi:hypothetical protein